MPYDHDKTREMLKIASTYAQHPTGAYISRLATQLLDAEADIKLHVTAAADLRATQQEAERRLTAESSSHSATKLKLSEEIRVLREGNKRLLEALTLIHADARGAKKIAGDAIAAAAPPATQEVTG